MTTRAGVTLSLAAAFTLTALTYTSNGQLSLTNESDTVSETVTNAAGMTASQRASLQSAPLIDTSPRPFLLTNLAELDEQSVSLARPVLAAPPVAEIQILDGGALAEYAPHKAFVAENPNTTDAVQLSVPGQAGPVQMNSHVVGLGFWDTTSGETTLFAWPRESGVSQAEILSAAEVRITNALQGADADLLYHYSADRFSQSLVLHSQIPSPQALGVGTEASRLRLVLITEFEIDEAPLRAPATIDLRERNLALGVAGEDFMPDETLFFGSAMRMTVGKAFLLGDTNDVPCGKRFINVDGHWLLLEFSPWPLVKALIDQLPEGTLHAGIKARGNLKKLMASLSAPLGAPASLPAKSAPKRRQASTSPASPSSQQSNNPLIQKSPVQSLLTSAPARKGVVLDYELVSSRLLNVKFGDSTAKTGLAAVGQTTNDYWNVYYYPSSTHQSVTNLIWSDTNGPSVGIVVSNAPSIGTNGSGDKMYNTFITDNGANISLTITNLPSNIYNFYLYGHGPRDSANGVFKLFRTTELGYKGTTLWGGGTALGPSPLTWENTNWTPGIQFQVFTNIAVTNQTIRIDVLAGADGYRYLNGLQIVPTASLPPPQPVVSNIINLNMGDDPPPKVGFAAIGLNTNDFWNWYSDPLHGAAYSMTNLADAAGLGTASGVVIQNAQGLWGIGLPDAMYNGYTYSQDAGNTSLTFTNLPDGNYDLYVYAHTGGEADNAIVQVWSGDRDYGPLGTGIWGGVPETVTWQESQQYVVFHDVVVHSNQPVTILVGHSIYGYANCNGLQLVFKGSADTNNNSLPDAWEKYYFGNTTNTATGDSDADYIPNIREFELGLDPTRANTNASERLWVEDALPMGAYTNENWSSAWSDLGEAESWTWTNDWSGGGWGGGHVLPYSGTSMHVSDNYAGSHQHWFDKSIVNLHVGTGDVLIAYINLDSNSPPSEIMLQWYVTEANGSGSWEHRAYWGANTINWGANITASRRYVTNLPAAGTWVRLEVPASAVGLEGRVIQGMAFTLYGGRAAWDRAGKLIPDVDGNGLPDAWETQFFGRIGIDPNADSDGDGLSNLQEYQNGTNPAGKDTDYDGICDGQELNDGTIATNADSVLPTLLSSFRFDTNTWRGLENQLPIATNNLALANGISSNAVSINSTNPAWLTYADTNDCVANINLRKGSARFWFKSAWNSGSIVVTNGQPRLLEVGSKGSTDGWWALFLDSAGNNLSFCTPTNSTGGFKTNFTVPVSFTSNQWHQIVLTWSPTNSGLYLDGQLKTNSASAVTNWPNAQARAQGWRIGSDVSGTNQAKGRFDNLQIYNYVLSQTEVTAGVGSGCPPSVDVMLVIDRSHSMTENLDGPSKFQAAQRAATNFVNHLRLDPDQAGLVSFWSNTFMYQGLTTVRTSIITAITSLTDSNGTRMDYGITNAYAELTNQAHRNPGSLGAMVLLTDGFNEGGTTDQVITAATTVTNAGLRMITVGLGANPDTNLLKRIASTTNDFYLASSSSQLDQAYDSIANVLCRLTNQAPYVLITNLTEYQILTEPVTIPIRATATDPENGLVRVDFYGPPSSGSSLPSTNLIGSDYYAPFFATWTNFPYGTNLILAVAVDEFGLSSTSSVHVIVNHKPYVTAGPGRTLIWVEGGTSISTNLAGFSSDDGMPYHILTNLWTTNSGPGTVTFSDNTVTNPATVTFYTNGTYSLRLSASDGAFTNTSDVTIRILRRPSVTITNPLSNATISLGLPIKISVTATDLDGTIANLSYYTNGSLLASVPITPQLSTLSSQLFFTNAPLGTNILTVIATDNDTLTRTSSPPVTNVVVAPACVTAPTNLVHWWKAESNCLDSVGANNGALAGNAAYGSGFVGAGLVLDGTGDAVTLSNTASLQTQTFTIEGWIKRSNSSQVSGTGADAVIFGYGQGGYGLGLDHSTGKLFLSRIGISAVYGNTPITDTVWHHVAVTKTGTTVVFYVDGVANTASAYSVTFTFTTSVAIGARGDNLAASFYGSVDEVSFYSRALATNEIQNIYNASILGKCSLLSVQITSPTNGTICIPGTTLSVTGLVSGGSSLATNVVFYNGTNVIASGVSNANQIYTLNWRPSSGTNLLGAVALTMTSLTATSSTVTVVATNRAPIVSAGTNKTLALPQTQGLLLDGSVTETDGPKLPPDISWSSVAGPGPVRFGAAGTLDSADIKVWFTNAGIYRLRLTASDSQLSASNEVDVIVTATNATPNVNAGPDQTIMLGDYVYLAGTVTDDGLPTNGTLVVSWTTNSGLGLVTFDSTNSPGTLATFSAAGTYVLKLTANDGEITNSDTATITVNAFSSTERLTNIHMLSFGVGGLKNGPGTMHVTGLTGEVRHAYLYWHGPTDSLDTNANSQVLVNGRLVTGRNIGTTHDNGWLAQNSQAYRADVTTLVKAFGNGDYILSGFSKGGTIQANGASLLIFYDGSGVTHDYLLWQGNDSNAGSSFMVNGSVFCSALQPDGKIVLGGQFSALAGEQRNNIMRLNSDGGLDTSFDPGSGADGPVTALAIQSDGKILIGGHFNSVDGVQRTNCARLLTDGSVDTSFSANADGELTAVVLQPDQNILIAGDFTAIGASSRTRVARLLTNGTVDTTFSASADDMPYCLALQTNGMIIIGGAFTTVNGTSRNHIARLNTNGSLDSSFNPDADNIVYSFCIQPDGKILVGGVFRNIGGLARDALARLSSGGSGDASFDLGATPLGPTGIGVIYALSLQGGNIVAGGSFAAIGTNLFAGMARFDLYGHLDTNFLAYIWGFTGASVETILEQPDGRIFIGGSFSHINSEDHRSAARLMPDGPPEVSPYDENWHASLPLGNYSSGSVRIELHVSDGQYLKLVGDVGEHFGDPSLTLNESNWLSPAEVFPCGTTLPLSQLFAGISVPNTAPECRGLWDIISTNATGFPLPATGLNEYRLRSHPNNEPYPDLISLIAAVVELPTNCFSGLAALPVSAPTNVPPLTHADEININQGLGVKVIDVLANDRSADGKPLEVAAVGSPAHGQAESIYQRSAVLYTANPFYSGDDTFSYTAIDTYGNTSTQRVTVHIGGGPAMGTLVCGQSVANTLGSTPGVSAIRGGGLPAAFYKIQGSAGRVVEIDLYSWFHRHLYLINPRGNVVASATSDIMPSDHNSIEYTFEETGTYTIEVTTHRPRELGPYNLSIAGLDGVCAPAPILQYWVDGIQLPAGGTIDFGSDLSKTIIATNVGTADIEPFRYLGLYPDDPFTISPTNVSSPLDSALSPLPPNSYRAITLTVDSSSSGAKTGKLVSGYNGGYSDLMTLSAFVNPPGTGPAVSLTNPASNTVFYTPANISVAATASSTGSVSKVEFFANSGFGRIKIGESTTPPYSVTWHNPPAQSCALFARATDNAGRMTSSAPVPIRIANHPPNLAPVAVNDYVNVFNDGRTNIIDILLNDSDPNGDPLTIVSAVPQNGTNTIIVNPGSAGRPARQVLAYTPIANSYGDDIITYTISDGHNGTAKAKVYVHVIQTSVQITSPSDNSPANPDAQVQVTASASSYEAEVERVDFFVNNRRIGGVATPPYQINWTNSGPGVYVLTARAFDTKGFTTVSEPVRVRVSAANDSPLAEIANLADGQVIREGSFDLVGTAGNSNLTVGVAYQVRLYRPDDGTPLEQRLVASLASVVGRKTNDLLAHLDFSMVRNGAYLLELEVDSLSGTNVVNSLTQPVSFILESNLKIGQFTFSEQDLTIPVSGIPLTVTRTYDSINPTLGDFGYSWNYALNDMDVQFDEERGTVPAIPSGTFNMRIGGPRDVTLTLPDGRRTTFYYAPEQGQCNSGDGAQFCLLAKWKAPYGVNATLTPLDDNRMVWLWGGLQWWYANSQAGPDNFDFSGFTLTTSDGTAYVITRATNAVLRHYLLDSVDHAVTSYGKASLKRIITRAGDRIEISPTAIQHYNATNHLTRSLVLVRTNNNLISAIFDPITWANYQISTNNRPSLKYEYDTNLNLIAVYRLVNTNLAVPNSNAFLKTTYHYTNLTYPHFLTSIDDPRGVPAARTLYDSSGRLLSVTDAAGNKTTFDHELEGHKETVTDALNHKTIHFYDDRGNVTTSIDALSRTVTRAYDYNNNVLAETDPLGHVTTYTYNGRGLRLTSTDPLNHTNAYTYDDRFSLVTSITDALGHGTTNLYDNNGDLTTTLQSLAGRLIGQTNEYNGQTAQLTASVDPLGTRTEYSYDSLGSLVSTRTLNSGGTTLSSNSFTYNESGNKLSDATVRTLLNGQKQTNITTYIYDSRSRVIETRDPLYDSNAPSLHCTKTTYNSTGKPDTTTDTYGRVTHYFYDIRGNLTQTQYPDGSTSRTVYDQLNRAFITTDRTAAPESGTVTTNKGTRTVFDDVGRTIRTERLTNIILVLADTPTSSGETVYDCQLQEPGPSVVSASSTEYDEAGRVDFTKDDRGATTSYGYDVADRRTAVRNALGNVTTYAYDANGNQTNVTDALGRTTVYVYDDLGRQKEVHYSLVTNESTAVTFTLYDDAGRRTAEVDLGGVTNAFKYDALGRLVAVTNALGTTEQIVTSYAYDEAGNQTNQVDAEGRVTSFEFDALGRRLKRTLPDLSGSPTLYETTTYELATNANGDRVLQQKMTDFNGLAVYHVFDVMDRLEKKVVGNATNNAAVTLSYYPNGQRAQMIDSSGTNNYAYDDFNRLAAKTNFLGNITYFRDVAGNVTSLSSSASFSDHGNVEYSYDPLGRLQSVNKRHFAIGGGTWVNVLANYSYSAVGNLVSGSVTLSELGGSGETRTSWHYDARNRLTDMQTLLATDVSTNTLASFNYNPGDRPLHATGSRMAARETINATTNITHAVNYYYDNLYRLTKEDITTGSPSGTIDYGPNTGYSGYDKVGNRRSRKVTGSALISAGVTDFNGQSFDARDRLTGAGNSFDSNGNTLRGTVSPAQTADDDYDYENRLITRHTTLSSQPTTINLVYDGDGNRVAKFVVTSTTTNATYYLVDDQNPTSYPQVIVELTTNNSGAFQVTRAYEYGHSLLDHTLDRSGSPATYLYGLDGHGNVRFLMDNSGTITNTYSYDAFGILTSKAGSVSNDNLFTGEQFDRDLGLYYLRSRHLGVMDGRFWTMDTFRSSPRDVLAIHRYLYCAANPVNHKDPSGLHLIPPKDSVDKEDYRLALNYLSASGTARLIISTLDTCDTDYIIVPNVYTPVSLAVTDYGAGYDADERKIYWPPRLGFKWKTAFGWKYQSAALGLIHELGHAFHHEIDPASYLKARVPYKPANEWYSPEEQRTILEIENPIATTLHEPTRDRHVYSEGFAGSFRATSSTARVELPSNIPPTYDQSISPYFSPP